MAYGHSVPQTPSYILETKLTQLINHSLTCETLSGFSIKEMFSILSKSGINQHVSPSVFDKLTDKQNELSLYKLCGPATHS